jgi:ribulose-phosphate 3-epimerase
VYRIAASILSADRLRLGDEVRRVVAAGADAIHLNVIDAEDRPNLTLGHMVCASLRQHCPLPIGVLLRVPAKAALVERFAEAGADSITVHAAGDTAGTEALLRQIARAGCQAGLVLDAAVPADALPALLAQVELVHVSCAQPGSAARRFDDARLRQVAQARRWIDASGRAIRLQVDGDLRADTIGRAAAAGADGFVVGRAIFGTGDYEAAIHTLRRALAAAQPMAAAA